MAKWLGSGSNRKSKIGEQFHSLNVASRRKRWLYVMNQKKKFVFVIEVIIMLASAYIVPFYLDFVATNVGYVNSPGVIGVEDPETLRPASRGIHAS